MNQDVETNSNGTSPQRIPEWSADQVPAASSFYTAWQQFTSTWLQSVLRVNSELVKSAMELNNEVSSFVNHRLERDVALTQRLATNHTSGDVSKTCSEFLSEATDEYSRETQKITAMLTDVTAGLPALYAREGSQQAVKTLVTHLIVAAKRAA